MSGRVQRSPGPRGPTRPFAQHTKTSARNDEKVRTCIWLGERACVRCAVRFQIRVGTALTGYIGTKVHGLGTDSLSTKQTGMLQGARRADKPREANAVTVTVTNLWQLLADIRGFGLAPAGPKGDRSGVPRPLVLYETGTLSQLYLLVRLFLY